MKQQRTYKRKMLDFSVNPALQVRMIARVVLILFGSLFLSGLIYYYFADREINNSLLRFHIHARNFLDFLLPIVLSSLFLSLALGLLIAMFLPKSFAGSLYRLERELKRIAAGDLSGKVCLRRSDQMTPLADQINQLLANWRKEMATIQRGLGKAHEICVAGTYLSPGERLEELEKIHGYLLSEVNKLRTSVDRSQNTEVGRRRQVAGFEVLGIRGGVRLKV